MAYYFASTLFGGVWNLRTFALNHSLLCFFGCKHKSSHKKKIKKQLKLIFRTTLN